MAKNVNAIDFADKISENGELVLVDGAAVEHPPAHAVPNGSGLLDVEGQPPEEDLRAEDLDRRQ